MEAQRLYRYYLENLLEVYPTAEAKCSAMVLMADLHGISKAELILNPQKEVVVENSLLESRTRSIRKYTPIQYIVGQAEFYSRRFVVGPQVLIPRPETEELVAKIVASAVEGSRVLDIGTGSGAIAVTLCLEIPDAVVEAVDISLPAIAVATENARRLGAGAVVFRQLDILSCRGLEQTYDIIVSNPPYVCEKEKPLMRDNVLLHEPHGALFVPDNDPLLFYRKIATLAYESLAATGVLWFEINEAYGQQTRQMLEEIGFGEIELFSDISGKPRICSAKR